jgi:hypothetical protein
VVENKPGAATNLGADFVAKAAPDGYTVLLGDVATYAANPSLYKKLQFDPHADAWLRGDARGRNGSLPQKLAAGPARWLAARHRRPSGPISSAAEGSTTRSISNADFLSPVDQLGQFLSGIEHTCFYSRRWHVENVRYFVDRLLCICKVSAGNGGGGVARPCRHTLVESKGFSVLALVVSIRER